MEQMFQGVKVQGVNIPGIESSEKGKLPAQFTPRSESLGNESSKEQKFQVLMKLCFGE